MLQQFNKSVLKGAIKHEISVLIVDLDKLQLALLILTALVIFKVNLKYDG